MADHQPNHLFPDQLDVRDPDFPRQCLSMARQICIDFAETVTATKKTIADAREVMAETDRILARRV
jgi:hypothetical protein